MAAIQQTVTHKVRCPFCMRKVKVPVFVSVDIVGDEIYASATPDAGPVWDHYLRKHLDYREDDR